ncbi:MAG: sigma-70 family RNA polymerase sigma factor [Planctomycetia bacterium]|nr:sigma-70 family RNA polymerase sigma factor [Planctomycetia bacterium]
MSQSPETFDSTSSSLLDRVRFKDVEAWRQLVRLYAPLVYSWCARAGLQSEDAADVVQEVFRSVAISIGDFRRDRPGDTFRGWLRVITRNKVHDLNRRRAGEPVAVGGSEHHDLLNEIPVATDPMSDDDSRESRGAVLRRALDLIRLEFEERTWQAFWRSAVEDQSTADVAAALGMTSTAVRKARSRVFRRLREALADPPEAM